MKKKHSQTNRQPTICRRRLSSAEYRKTMYIISYDICTAYESLTRERDYITTPSLLCRRFGVSQKIRKRNRTPRGTQLTRISCVLSRCISRRCDRVVFFAKKWMTQTRQTQYAIARVGWCHRGALVVVCWWHMTVSNLERCCFLIGSSRSPSSSSSIVTLSLRCQACRASRQTYCGIRQNCTPLRFPPKSPIHCVLS